MPYVYDPLLEELESLLNCLRMEQNEAATPQYALTSDVVKLAEIVRTLIKERT